MSKLVDGKGVVRSEFRFDALIRVLIVICGVILGLPFMSAFIGTLINGSFAWPIEGSLLFAIVFAGASTLRVLFGNRQWVECDGKVIKVKDFWQKEVKIYSVDEVTTVGTVDNSGTIHAYEIRMGRKNGIVLSLFYMSNVEELVDYVEKCRVKGNDVVGELERLASLRERGVLTEEEFERAKAKVLGD